MLYNTIVAKGPNDNQLEPGTDHGEQASGYLVLDKPWPSMRSLSENDA